MLGRGTEGIEDSLSRPRPRTCARGAPLLAAALLAAAACHDEAARRSNPPAGPNRLDPRPSGGNTRATWRGTAWRMIREEQLREKNRSRLSRYSRGGGRSCDRGLARRPASSANAATATASRVRQLPSASPSNCRPMLRAELRTAATTSRWLTSTPLNALPL